MKKTAIFTTLILLFSFSCEAQNIPSFYPFKGFHVGITGQSEYIQKCNYVYLSGKDPMPRSLWTYGWEAGMEFSYHFAKYFGVSIGINYGTALAFRFDVYFSKIPDLLNGGWIDENRFDPSLYQNHFSEIHFPIKLEFHYPLHKNLFFTTEAGVKIRGVGKRLNSWKGAIGSYDFVLLFAAYPPQVEEVKEYTYYEQWGVRYTGKIYVDLLLGLGLYYKLPYGDLLRFTAGVNIAFNNTIEGDYEYYRTGSKGTFSLKHDYIYTQLSYIHTLNWQKAKRYLRNNEYSFSSKKERRKTIVEMLNQY